MFALDRDGTRRFVVRYWMTYDSASGSRPVSRMVTVVPSSLF